MNDWRPEDKAWIKERKALWKAVKPALTALADMRLGLKPLESWFLSGKDMSWFTWQLLVLHPSDDPEVLKAFVHEIAANSRQAPSPDGRHGGFASRFLDLCGNGWTVRYRFCSAFGLFGELERRVVDYLMPAHYSNDEYEVCRGEFKRIFPYRAENFCYLFLENAIALLSAPHFNPHHAWQYLWPQWLEALAEPELAAEDWVKDGEGMPPKLRDFFRRLRRFVFPALNAPHNAAAHAFAERLAAVIETSPLPATVRAAWEYVQTDEGALSPVEEPSAPFSKYLAVKTLHGAQADAEAVVRLVDIYHRFGYTDEAFRTERLEHIDIGPQLSLGFARLLGYAPNDPRAKENYGKQLPCECPVPAQCYRIRTTSHFTALERPGSEIVINLVLLERAAGFVPDEDTPWLLVYAEYGELYRTYRPAHEAVCHERYARECYERETGQRWVGYIRHELMRGKEKIRRDWYYQWCHETGRYAEFFTPLHFGDEACERARRYKYAP